MPDSRQAGRPRQPLRRTSQRPTTGCAASLRRYRSSSARRLSTKSLLPSCWSRVFLSGLRLGRTEGGFCGTSRRHKHRRKLGSESLQQRPPANPGPGPSPREHRVASLRDGKEVGQGLAGRGSGGERGRGQRLSEARGALLANVTMVHAVPCYLMRSAHACIPPLPPQPDQWPSLPPLPARLPARRLRLCPSEPPP